MEPSPILFDELPIAHRLLRLAVVTETYPPEVNGVAMTTGRIVSAMQARGHQIQLIRPRQSAQDVGPAEPNLDHILKPGIPIPRYNNLRMGLPAKSSLLKLWREKRPDVVHLVTEGPLGWSALSAALKLNIPVTSDFHTNFHHYSRHYGLGWLKTPIESYLRKFHNRTRLTLVPTHAMRDELLQDGYRNLKVVARGVDTQLFTPARRSDSLRAAWGVRPSDVVALYVGRLAAEKNLPVVLRAFAALRARQPSAKLVLVGDGPMRHELAQAFPDTIFAGMRTGLDLATFYASGDVFLFPSLTETFGNVTLEAMASGLVVIAYDYAAARDLIAHRENGLLAPFDAADTFCALAGEAAAEPKTVRKFGTAARQTAQDMSWSTIYSQFEQALFDVVKTSERNGYAATHEFSSRPA
ncbi:MAG: glycosyltransferase family 1 protein [Burkholderiales bacterium]|nr:glycosyltransferase family 1 protein [Burkholderiales bacterium]